MSNTVTDPNMGFQNPDVGQDPGPDYASNVSNALTTIGAHNHSAGNGVRVNPSGLLINIDLPFGSNNATLLRSVRFSPQSSTLSGVADLGCLYEAGVDLYYNDGLGNQVRITQSGGVAGSPGSISNLTSPASAAYVAGTQTFVWQSAANTPANMDFASATLRNLVANSFGLTLSPPNSMSVDYNIVLPFLPVSTSFLTIDSSGNMGTSSSVSGVDLIDHSVTQVKKALMTTGSTVGAGGFATSASSGTYLTSSTTLNTITNFSVTITTTGRPVFIGFMSDGLGAPSTVATSNNSGGAALGQIAFYRDVTQVSLKGFGWGQTSGSTSEYPGSMFSFIDIVAAGTYTYVAQAAVNINGATALSVSNTILYAYEI